MGKLTVQLPETLHREIETRAQQEGVSLNHYVTYALTQKVTSSYTIQVLPIEMPQQQQERFNALLKRLGPPNREAARVFLAEREKETVEDPVTAALIARVEAKFATVQ